jgi:hypothetical protein
LDNKLLYLSNEIKALGELKKKLSQAKTLGLEIAAQTLMEGTAISSLTIAPAKQKTKETIFVTRGAKIGSTKDC